jgi:hypothetical protein
VFVVVVVVVVVMVVFRQGQMKGEKGREREKFVWRICRHQVLTSTSR